MTQQNHSSSRRLPAASTTDETPLDASIQVTVSEDPNNVLDLPECPGVFFVGEPTTAKEVLQALGKERLALLSDKNIVTVSVYGDPLGEKRTFVTIGRFLGPRVPTIIGKLGFGLDEITNYPARLDVPPDNGESLESVLVALLEHAGNILGKLKITDAGFGYSLLDVAMGDSNHSDPTKGK